MPCFSLVLPISLLKPKQRNVSIETLGIKISASQGLSRSETTCVTGYSFILKLVILNYKCRVTDNINIHYDSVVIFTTQL